MARIAPGEFCWVELATPDKKAGLAFYSGLFGWSTAEQEIGLTGRAITYSVVRLGERLVGSVYELVAEQLEGGVVPHWLPYLSVESADRAVREAEDMGAICLVDPVDVFHAGRMSVLEDPGGASFAVWQAKALPGFQVSHDPGSPRWFELVTADVAKAVEFYGALFGWAGGKGPPEAGSMTRNDRPIAGVTELPSGRDLTPRWTTHFAVADCATTCKRIQGSGGSVGPAPVHLAGVGRAVAVADPHGAQFAIVEPGS